MVVALAAEALGSPIWGSDFVSIAATSLVWAGLLQFANNSRPTLWSATPHNAGPRYRYLIRAARLGADEVHLAEQG